MDDKINQDISSETIKLFCDKNDEAYKFIFEPFDEHQDQEKSSKKSYTLQFGYLTHNTLIDKNRLI